MCAEIFSSKHARLQLGHTFIFDFKLPNRDSTIQTFFFPVSEYAWYLYHHMLAAWWQCMKLTDLLMNMGSGSFSFCPSVFLSICLSSQTNYQHDVTFLSYTFFNLLTDFLSVSSFHVHLMCPCITPPLQVRHSVFMHLLVSWFVLLQLGGCLVPFDHDGFLPRCSDLVHARADIFVLFDVELQRLHWLLKSSHICGRDHSSIWRCCSRCVFAGCSQNL